MSFSLGWVHSKFQDWESSTEVFLELMDRPWLTAFGRYPPMPHYYHSHGHVCGGSVGGMLEKVAKPCAVQDPDCSKTTGFQDGFARKMHGPKPANFCFHGTPVLSLWAFSIDSVCGSFTEATCALHLRTSSTLSWLLHVHIQSLLLEGFVVQFSHHRAVILGLRPVNEARSCYAKASMTDTETCSTVF